MKLFINQNQIGNRLIKHKNAASFIIVSNSTIFCFFFMVASLVQLWNTEHMPNKMSISYETFSFSGRNDQLSTQIFVSTQLL